MSNDPNKQARAVRRLLAFADDVDLTDDEARAELASDGVDVDAFVKRGLAQIAAKKKEARLAAWQPVARQKAAEFQGRAPARDRSRLSHSELLAEARERNLQMAARNWEELTEEDLRTLLADADELGD